MPTYEYHCPSCGRVFDVFQKMSDEPGADCPTCGAAAERKLSGGAGFLFKGEGFYITDYRSEGYRKAAAKEKGASEGASSGSTSSSDASSGSSSSSSGGASGSTGPSGGSAGGSEA
jgi:putative FmdB family regulatory protein